MGLPIGTALFGLPVGARLAARCVGLLVDIPVWAPVIGGHGRARRGHRLRAVPPLAPPGVPRRRASRSRTSVGRSLATAGQVGRLRRRHRRRGDPRAGRRPAPVRHRGGIGISLDGAGDGARRDHPAAGPARAGRSSPPDVERCSPLPARTTDPGPTPRCCGGPAGVRTSAGTPRRTPSPARCCSSPSPRRSSPCGSDCPTRAAMPQSRTERRAYDLVAEGFGPGATGPLVVAVDVSPGPVGGGAAGLGAVAADPGIAVGRSRPRGRDVRRRRDHRPADDDTAGRRGTARTSTGCAARCCPPRWRAARRPRMSAATPPPCPTSASASQERLPIFLVAVVAMSYLLLMVLFRSHPGAAQGRGAEPAERRARRTACW